EHRGGTPRERDALDGEDLGSSRAAGFGARGGRGGRSLGGARGRQGSSLRGFSSHGSRGRSGRSGRGGCRGADGRCGSSGCRGPRLVVGAEQGLSGAFELRAEAQGGFSGGFSGEIERGEARKGLLVVE